METQGKCTIAFDVSIKLCLYFFLPRKTFKELILVGIAIYIFMNFATDIFCRSCTFSDFDRLNEDDVEKNNELVRC